MSLEWMAWTLPTSLFFITIALMLVGMTIWQFIVPTVERRGVLPLVTTRGDRFFIGLLTSAYIHLAWIGLTNFDVWIATIFSVFWMAAVMRWA